MLKIEVYYWASALLLAKLCSSIMTHQFYVVQSYVAMKVKIACSALIYKKILKLSMSSLDTETSVGQVISHCKNIVE